MTENGTRAVTFAEIEESDQEWLWPGMIPAGLLTVAFGPPKVSKTSLVCEYAARVSRGDVNPDGTSLGLLVGVAGREQAEYQGVTFGNILGSHELAGAVPQGRLSGHRSHRRPSPQRAGHGQRRESPQGYPACPLATCTCGPGQDPPPRRGPPSRL